MNGLRQGLRLYLCLGAPQGAKQDTHGVKWRAPTKASQHFTALQRYSPTKAPTKGACVKPLHTKQYTNHTCGSACKPFWSVVLWFGQVLPFAGPSHGHPAPGKALEYVQ